MGKVILCVGEYAEVPYYVESIGLHLYSMEELCYYLTENAFLLDREIMNRNLVDWIDEQCGLKELGRTLYGFLNSASSVSIFVGAILEYVGYVSKSEIEKLQNYLKENAHLTALEKEKAHADYLVANERYMQAQLEYHSLRQQVSREEALLYAKICHNEGVAYAGMLRYKEASDCFYEAYEVSGEEQSLEEYLCATRLYMQETEYVSMLADHKEFTKAALCVETKFTNSDTRFRTSKDWLRIEKLLELRKQGEMDRYEQRMEEEIESMKESYRQKNI